MASAHHITEFKSTNSSIMNILLPMLPDLGDLKCRSSKMLNMHDLQGKADPVNVYCCHSNGNRIPSFDQDSNSRQHLDFEYQDVDEFLLPDLNNLQSMHSGHEDISSPSNEQVLSAAHGIVNVGLQTKTAEGQPLHGWQAELNRAFETLSAFEIVDHGLIDEE
jgi:hypothetical protein